jgi:hypothetical protein
MPTPILENLDERPKSSDDYLWCDYVELRCLTDIDLRFSRGNLSELLQETSEQSIPDDSGDDDEVLAETNPELVQDALRVEQETPLADQNEAKVGYIFSALKYRAELFAGAYPFVVDEHATEIRIRDIDSAEREFYVQLLLSASLRLVPKTRRKELTKPFEELSLTIFKCLMPDGWEVHEFGAASATRYRGHLYDRLTKLTKDLRGTLDLKKEHFKTKNSGDGGLDLVAWHPMGDERTSIPIALGQCGCTAEEWSLKSLEASPQNLGGNLHTLHPWATYYFMPQDLMDGRNVKGDWQRRNDITRCVMVDRLRLMRLAKHYGVTEACVCAPKPIADAKTFVPV